MLHKFPLCLYIFPITSSSTIPPCLIGTIFAAAICPSPVSTHSRSSMPAKLESSVSTYSTDSKDSALALKSCEVRSNMCFQCGNNEGKSGENKISCFRKFHSRKPQKTMKFHKILKILPNFNRFHF